MFALQLSCLVLAFLVVYHHLLYPYLLKYFAKASSHKDLAKAPSRGYRRMIEDEALPSISVLIPACNEAMVIAEKINNMGCLDYPADKLEIVIVCDGCSDDTAQRARFTASLGENSHLNIRIIEHQNNRGKLAIINDYVANFSTELVVLSDASALLSVDALLLGAEHFKREEVGVVAASYRLYKPGSEGEDLYWRYQSQIKQGEAALGAPIGVHGACYVLRRDCFTPLAEDVINDDFILPMNILSQGWKIAYEPDMLALELEQACLAQDSKRRIRIGAGNMQQLLRMAHLLSPRFGGVAFAFASGKALRILMPFILIAMLLGTSGLAYLAYLDDQAVGLYILLSLTQLMGYGLAFVAPKLLYLGREAGKSGVFNNLRDRMRNHPLCQLSTKILHGLNYLVVGHYNNLHGALRYLSGLERGGWKRVSPAHTDQRSKP